MSGVRVTAILSSFNRPEGLKRSFDSVLAQTVRDQVEIIVCDDASPDDRVQVLLGEFEREPDVSVIRGESRPMEHKKQYCTFTELINRAMDRARGEHFSYITDGNLWTQQRCEMYLRFLDENPEVFLVWGMVQNVRDGELMAMPPYCRMPMANILRQIHWGNFVDHGSVMHRQTRLRWSTRPESWRFADWVYWRKLLRNGKLFANVPFHGEVFNSDKDSLGRCLVERHESFEEMYRRRAGSGNGSGTRNQGERKEEEMVEEKKEEMSTVDYAKNVSGKIQLIPLKNSNGTKEVGVDDIVPLEEVLTDDGMMYPGFSPYGQFAQYVPKPPEPPKGDPKETKTTVAKIGKPKVPKVPFERMKSAVVEAEKRAAEMEAAEASQTPPKAKKRTGTRKKTARGVRRPGKKPQGGSKKGGKTKGGKGRSKRGAGN